MSAVSDVEAGTGQRRLAAITGGGSGIGQATAYRLSMDGFDVAILDIDKARAETVARSVTDRNGSAFPVWIDVTDSSSVEDAFAAVEAWRKAPDVLVNSAGIMRVSSIVDCTLTDFRTVMDVNVTGAFLCAQRASKRMLAQRYGRIVNLSSISAERAGIGRVAYGTSKGAVASLTRASRSCRLNRGFLPSFFATATMMRSKSLAARCTTSKWPLVNGSKLPG